MYKVYLDKVVFFNNRVYYCYTNTNELLINDLDKNGEIRKITLPKNQHINNFYIDKSSGLILILSDQKGNGKNKLWLIRNNKKPEFIGPSGEFEWCVQAEITSDKKIIMNIIVNNEEQHLREFIIDTYEEKCIFKSKKLFSFVLENDEIIIKELKDKQSINLKKNNRTLFEIPKVNFYDYCFELNKQYFYLSDEFTDYCSLVKYTPKEKENKRLVLSFEKELILNIIKIKIGFIVLTKKNGWDYLYILDYNFKKIKILDIRGQIKAFDYDEKNDKIIAILSQPNVPEHFVILDIKNNKKIELNKKYISNFDYKEIYIYRKNDQNLLPLSIYLPQNKNGKSVILLNGGPYSLKTVGYSEYINILVLRGYTLILPHIYGKDGFGKNYKNKINGKWGEEELKDIVYCYNYIKSVFSDDIGIVGVSYGGFLALLAATYTNCNWKFCVSFNSPTSINSFISKLGSLNQNLIDLINDGNKLKSPEKNIQNLKAPVIIIQSENDSKIDHLDTEDFVDLAKKHGKNILYFLIKNSGHKNYNFINTNEFNECMDLIDNI